MPAARHVQVKSAEQHDAALPLAFTALGYDLYRLVPGLQILAPFDPAKGFDPFQINLFACTPERAAALAARNLLVIGDAPPLSRPLPDAVAVLATRPFAAGLAAGWSRGTPAEAALSAALAAQDEDRPAAERLTLLRRSLAGLEAALRTEDHPATRLSYLRLLYADGRRGAMLGNLRPLIADNVTVGGAALAGPLAGRPFLPPLPSWDGIPVRHGLESWAAAMLADTQSASLHYSSYYRQDCVGALWEVRANPDCTPAMYRQLCLLLLRAGQRVRFSDTHKDTLLSPSPEHRNHAIWRELLSAG
jgi:hypothetical protein